MGDPTPQRFSTLVTNEYYGAVIALLGETPYYQGWWSSVAVAVYDFWGNQWFVATVPHSCGARWAVAKAVADVGEMAASAVMVCWMDSIASR
ncbi:MAG: hypothetical protein JRC77_10715 [Deltaproteobacteria bacterium]|nr:hypothetical protein [Deltaproteobacteria bacterium]